MDWVSKITFWHIFGSRENENIKKEKGNYLCIRNAVEDSILECSIGRVFICKDVL